MPFDDKKRTLLANTGIPPVFAQLLEDKSKTLGTLAIRAGSPFNRYLMPAAPKPLFIKEKTGNWGLAAGVIAVDPHLAKTVYEQGQWCLIKREPHHLPVDTDLIKPMLHHVSLREILAGLRGNLYQLVGTEFDIQHTHCLTIKAVDKSPHDCQIIFSINLMEKSPRTELQQEIDFAKLLYFTPLSEPEPDWWLNEWGKFKDCVSRYYPAQYKYANDADFKDIMVYGIPDKYGKLLPITGDQDLLWIAVPANQQALLKDFAAVYDTFSIEDVIKLYEARLNLYVKLGGNIDDAPENISNESIAELGYVTAYESYVIDEINKSFATSGIPHLRLLIQHAPENHNHDHLSPLDVKIVHVWRGETEMTEDEAHVIRYVMQPSYLQDNIFQINAKWDMKKWAPVVMKQLALKHPVDEDTMMAYRKFCNGDKNVYPFLRTTELRKTGA